MIDIFEAIQTRSYAKIMKAAKGSQDFNCTNDDGKTPLFLAVEILDDTIVEVLLDSGADANLCNISGETPLFLAVKKRVEVNQDTFHKNMFDQSKIDKIITLLLQAGADINKSCRVVELNKTASYESMLDSMRSVLKLMSIQNLNEESIDAADKDTGITKEYAKNAKKQTPWTLALNDYDLACFLIKNSNSIDTFDDDGKSPLILAIEKGVCNRSYHNYEESDLTLEVASLLLAKGANVDVSDKQGITPLLLATKLHCVERCRKQLIFLLLERGANVNVLGNDGRTPLFFILNDYELVKNFVERGVNVNVSDKQGVTPLLLAIKARNPLVVKLLIKAGAKLPDVFDILQNMNTLKEMGPEGRHPFSDFLNPPPDEEEFFQCLLQVFEKCEGWDSKDQQGRSVLHIIAENYSPEISDLLTLAMKRQQDKDSQCYKGKTPLHIILERNVCCEEGKELIYTFLQHNANTNIQDHQGKTPLHLAMNLKGAHYYGHQVVLLLLKHNANPNIQDNQGKTPLHYAALDQNNELMKMLISYGANLHIKDKNSSTPFQISQMLSKATSQNYYYDDDDDD